MFTGHHIRLVQFEYNTTNIVSGFLLYNACQFFTGLGYRIGKLYPNYVEFRDYHCRQEDFCGQNMIAVRKKDAELIQLLNSPSQLSNPTRPAGSPRQRKLVTVRTLRYGGPMNLGSQLKTALHRVLRLLAPHHHYSESLQGTVADQFHKIYYGLGEQGQTWLDTRWLGVPVAKIPLDLWVYQEILFETKPDLIIECGTAKGGSAYYLACLMDLMGKGRIITIDLITLADRPNHPRITYLTGSSISEKIVEEVKKHVVPGQSVMVILDSDHSALHVHAELQIYSKFVTKGAYLVVEDCNLNGHPVWPTHGPGPMEAVEKFLKETNQFQVDKSREKFLVSFNPNGYLKRI
jgi:cephalosporin hydroxylase